MKIAIVVGEVSGDQRAAEVIAALRQQYPDASIRGMAGKRLQELGVEPVVDATIVGGVMGFSAVLKKMPELFGAMRKMKTLIREWRPDVLFLVDFPDFNMRLASFAKAEGVKVLYYIPPKVWAWRPKRVRAFRQSIDQIAAIFPFEPLFHKKRGYQHTAYVGHPFVEQLADVPRDREGFCRQQGIAAEVPVVAVLPGSRRSEVLRHLPIQLDAVRLIRASGRTLTAVVVVPSEELAEIARGMVGENPHVVVLTGKSQEVLANADLGILKSGTCTLEAAFFQLPFVCIYRTSPLSASVAKRFLTIKEVSPVNIMRPGLVRELLQEACTGEAIAAEIISLMDSRAARDVMLQGFAEVREAFAGGGRDNRNPTEQDSAAGRVARLLVETAGPARMPHRALYGRLLSYLNPYRKTFLAALACMVFYGASDGVVPFLVKEVLDKVFNGDNAHYLYFFPLALIGMSVLRAAADFGQQYLMSKVGHSVVRDVRRDMNDHFLRLGPDFFLRNSTGDMLTRITSDALQFRSLLTDSVASILRDSIRIVALLGVAIWMDPGLAGIAVLFLPFGFLPVYALGRRLRELGRRGQDGVGALTGRLQESILGSKVVKIFCADEFERTRFEETNQQLTRTFITSERIRALAGPINEILASISVAAVLFYGGSSVLSGVRTQGAFIGFLIAVFLLYDPFKKLSRVHSASQQALASTARIFEILDTPPTIIDPPDARSLPAAMSITFADVTYAYPGTSRPALNNISATIAEGSKVALVGLSGSGKSTLVDMIPRFIDPDAGEVRLGDVSVRTATLAELRGRISMVSQHTFLFHDTVRNNIRYGDLKATDQQVRDAAEQAIAHEFISRLPKGYDTVLGEGGFLLSGGERQRLAIARAILKNAPILILDEATASLDNKSEREVQTALDTLMRNRTTIVIAHRLSTIIGADRILVMKEGRIVEDGCHEELLAKEGEYARLHQLQFGAGPGAGS